MIILLTGNDATYCDERYTCDSVDTAIKMGDRLSDDWVAYRTDEYPVAVFADGEIVHRFKCGYTKK